MKTTLQLAKIYASFCCNYMHHSFFNEALGFYEHRGLGLHSGGQNLLGSLACPTKPPECYCIWGYADIVFPLKFL